MQASDDVTACLERFEKSVEPKEFDPTDLERTFRIGCSFQERDQIPEAGFKGLRDRTPKAKDWEQGHITGFLEEAFFRIGLAWAKRTFEPVARELFRDLDVDAIARLAKPAALQS